IPDLLSNLLRLEHLDREAATRAIRRPLQRYNAEHRVEAPVSIEDGLVEALLEELRTGQVDLDRAAPAPLRSVAARSKVRIETPFLQVVLMRLWQEEMAVGSRVLKLSSLRRLGGAELIVRRHVDQLMDGIDETDRATAALLLRFLVLSKGTKVALTIPELVALVELPPDHVERVVTLLSAPDKLILRRVASAAEPGVMRYEIFHDVLAPAILDWRTRYVRAQEQAAAERRISQERRLARKWRWRAAGLALMTVVMLLLSVLVWWQARIAKARELAASAQAQIPIDPDRSLRLA